MPTCPRCKLERTPAYFVGRVSLCITCYSTIPANRDLNMAQLITKMKRARINRYTFTVVRRAEIDDELAKLLNELESSPTPDQSSTLSTEDILNFTRNRK